MDRVRAGIAPVAVVGCRIADVQRESGRLTLEPRPEDDTVASLPGREVDLQHGLPEAIAVAVDEALRLLERQVRCPGVARTRGGSGRSLGTLKRQDAGVRLPRLALGADRLRGHEPQGARHYRSVQSSEHDGHPAQDPTP